MISDNQNFYNRNDQGIYIPVTEISHREEEYDSEVFKLLCDMQLRHFWYVGRHWFLLNALRCQLGNKKADNKNLSAIDLGGGCGGWVSYLDEKMPGTFTEMALADSSLMALKFAQNVVGNTVQRYQIDLLDLHWRDRWDVAFLLDVLEHIPADEKALKQIWKSLKPGGLLFVTTPAIKTFWTHNDDMVNHVRRYSRNDFHRMADAVGFECCLTRYFMFFLSPLLMLSRIKRINANELTREQIREHLKRTHQVPAGAINLMLKFIFMCETPLGYYMPFPWGTSILGVFRKPSKHTFNADLTDNQFT